MLDSRDHNFSFSGLKTAVRYRLAEFEDEREAPELVNDMCASFQRAVVEVLVKKTLRAAKECGATLVTMSGGVSCNQALREQMAEACERAGLRLLTASAATLHGQRGDDRVCRVLAISGGDLSRR